MIARSHRQLLVAGVVAMCACAPRDEQLSVMIIGHADKIRLQVRSIGDDGKIWINSDSFLPTTVIGHEVLLFSRDPRRKQYRILEGGTVEALGAIHFAPPEMRNGTKGVNAKMLYLELQINGDKPRDQGGLGGVALAARVVAGLQVVADVHKAKRQPVGPREARGRVRAPQSVSCSRTSGGSHP